MSPYPRLLELRPTYCSVRSTCSLSRSCDEGLSVPDESTYHSEPRYLRRAPFNSGWILKENSVADEDNLSCSGQGKNVHVKPGYEIGDVQKIIPNAVPPSDMQLADQLADLIFRTSGINQELLGMSDESNTGIEVMLRQGAGLVTLQKYFDQWDLSLGLLGRLEQRIVQNKWSPAKIGRILGREPNVEFLAKTFSKYDVLVSEGSTPPSKLSSSSSSCLR